jgi:hypothetical protein
MKTNLTVKGIEIKLRGAEAPRRRPIKVTTHCIVVVETEMVNGLQINGALLQRTSRNGAPRRVTIPTCAAVVGSEKLIFRPEKNTFTPLTVC